MAWAMAWVAHQLVRDPLSLFQANAFYPYRGSLAFGDHLLPEGILGLPVNLITGNAVLALNLVTALRPLLLGARGRLRDRESPGEPPRRTHRRNRHRIQRIHCRENCCESMFSIFRDGAWPCSFSGGSPGRPLVAPCLAVLVVPRAAGSDRDLLRRLLGTPRTRFRRWPRTWPTDVVHPRHELVRLLVPVLTIGLAGLLFLSPYRRVAAESLAQKPIADGADIASFFLPGPDFWLFRGWLPAAPRMVNRIISSATFPSPSGSWVSSPSDGSRQEVHRALLRGDGRRLVRRPWARLDLDGRLPAFDGRSPRREPVPPRF